MLVQWLEISAYEIIDLFPNLILALVPFYSFMRFSLGKAGLLVLFLYVFLCVSRFIALEHLYLATVLTVIWVLLYLASYIICIKAPIRKLLFVLLIILNYGSFVAIIYSYILSNYYIGSAGRPYSFSSCLVLGLIYLVSYPVIFRMMHKKIRPLMEASENNRYWSFLWLVPATFCLSYYYNLYSNGGIILFSKSLSNVLFAVLFNLGALFVTYLTAHLIEVSNANLRLKSENYHLNMQSIQYDNLQNRMEDARRAGHDLRQVLAVIHSYLKDNNKEGLLTYISQYTESLPSVTPIAYCGNYAVNALIVYYETIAAKNNIQFSCDIEYPSKCGIADTDAVVLLGNLLENAIDACLRQVQEDAVIALHIRKIQDMIIITLDNSYSGAIHTAGEAFLSSKADRTGIGTDSVKRIALKYNGTAKFHYDTNRFHSSVMLLDGGISA